MVDSLLGLSKNLAGIQDLSGPKLLRNPTAKGGCRWTKFLESTWGPKAVQK
jgi:hypothetical protein